MPKLEKKVQYDVPSYGWDVKYVTNYTDISDNPAAPLIHTYSPKRASLFVLLAMHKTEGTVTVNNNHTYDIEHYVTVQRLDESFLSDDDASNNYRPTVKPHYAITQDGSKNVSQNCRTLLRQYNQNGQDEKVLYHYNDKPLNVHTHNGCVSPDPTIPELKNVLLQAKKDAFQTSLFFTSYVIDNINNKILITEHCLLIDDDYEHLAVQLKNVDNVDNLDDLMKTLDSSKIAIAAQKFNTTNKSEEDRIKQMVAQDNLTSTEKVTVNFSPTAAQGTLEKATIKTSSSSSSSSVNNDIIIPEIENGGNENKDVKKLLPNCIDKAEINPAKIESLNHTLEKNSQDDIKLANIGRISNQIVQLLNTNAANIPTGEAIQNAINEIPNDKKLAHYEDITHLLDSILKFVKNNNGDNADNLIKDCNNMKSNVLFNKILPLVVVLIGLALILVGVVLFAHSLGASSIFSVEMVSLGTKLVTASLAALTATLGVAGVATSAPLINYYGKTNDFVELIECKFELKPSSEDDDDDDDDYDYGPAKRNQNISQSNNPSNPDQVLHVNQNGPGPFGPFGEFRSITPNKFQ